MKENEKPAGILALRLPGKKLFGFEIACSPGAFNTGASFHGCGV